MHIHAESQAKIRHRFSLFYPHNTHGNPKSFLNRQIPSAARTDSFWSRTQLTGTLRVQRDPVADTAEIFYGQSVILESISGVRLGGKSGVAWNGPAGLHSSDAHDGLARLGPFQQLFDLDR